MMRIVSRIGSRMMMMMRIGVRSAGVGSGVDRGLGDPVGGLEVGLVARVDGLVVPAVALVARLSELATKCACWRPRG